MQRTGPRSVETLLITKNDNVSLVHAPFVIKSEKTTPSPLAVKSATKRRRTFR